MLLPKRSARRKKPSERVFEVSDHVSKNRWSDDEKRILLQCLRSFGYEGNNYLRIAEKIPSRTPLEVMYCLNYWKRLASVENIKSARTARLRINKEKRDNLMKIRKGEQATCDYLSYAELWIEQFSKMMPKRFQKGDSDSEGVYALSSIFLIISQLEAHPIPESEDDLDFKELYMFLHDLINGNPMKRLSLPMMKFILETLQEMVDLIHKPIMSTQMTYANYVASHRNFSESPKPAKIKTYHKKSKKESDIYCDSTLIEKVINLPHLNPLNIQVDDRIKKPVNLCREMKP